MGERTWGTRRGMGPVASTRIPGIMSGRSHDQQGMAATCKDSTHEVNEGGERWWDWRMGPYELRRGSNVPEAVPETAPAWVMPPSGKGALGTRRSRRPRPFRTPSRAQRSPWSSGRGGRPTRPSGGGCVPSLEPSAAWEDRPPGNACRAEVRTGLGKSDRPGSQGGLRSHEPWEPD
jgi:hypothetical protein